MVGDRPRLPPVDLGVAQMPFEPIAPRKALESGALARQTRVRRGEARDALLQASHDAGLMTRPVWTPMHQLPMFREAPRGDLATSESIARRLVNLPSSVVLGAEPSQAAGKVAVGQA